MGYNQRLAPGGGTDRTSLENPTIELRAIAEILATLIEVYEQQRLAPRGTDRTTTESIEARIVVCRSAQAGSLD